MEQVILACVEVMLVFPTVVTAVTIHEVCEFMSSGEGIICNLGQGCHLLFLNYFCHLLKELNLFLVLFIFVLSEEALSPFGTPPDSRDELAGVEDRLEVPLYFQHPPVLLDIYCSLLLLLSVLLRLTIDHALVLLVQPFNIVTYLRSW